MIDARAVIKSVFLDTCIENWWGIKNQICNCSQWYLLWAYYAMKMKTFSRNKKNLRGDDSFHVCCDVYQLSYESTEEESAKKTLTRTISKTRTKLRDFFFFAQLHISANIQWSFVVKTGLNYSQNMLYYKLYIYFFL